MSYGKRFTVFDVMEERGLFRANPANIDARGPQGEILYKGPVEFPKMLYHPEGLREVVSPGEDIATPFGPKHVNKHDALVAKVVATSEEEAELRAAGWHDRPSGSIVASGGAKPPISDADKVRELEVELAGLRGDGGETPAKSARK